MSILIYSTGEIVAILYIFNSFDNNFMLIYPQLMAAKASDK
ncbi:hypothetical protein CWATWH0402_5012 [Crocosphaera watsonii WH 0402]|uniref:Uncharacterized protein n=2 Tax=Crocosphaera watsonii TaxID=263511 RepID=T2JTB8_CROWT|nr:hypothetical protein CWATWH0005_3327 [Crocosphaera watsonii WH 0005]CCQ68291.1 hypothetical protein CWATWH0402_5012 [Crocosphaera watsonii WH 0402]